MLIHRNCAPQRTSARARALEGLVGSVLAALAIACGSNGDGGSTQPTGATITVSLSSSSATVQQGSSATITATATATRTVTGRITIVAENVPAGGRDTTHEADSGS